MHELEQLIQSIENEIPDLGNQQREDLFSISRFPHWETVLSNWFAFFMDKSNDHGYTGLFAEAFRRAIEEKEPSVQLDWLTDEIYAVQEEMTANGNFMDLVVFDTQLESCEGYANALVIEHKVYAALQNDLEDYISSVSVEGTKQGVLLSASAMNPMNEQYINITYQDLLKYLKGNFGHYAINANLQYFGYLIDFMNNLERMSETKDTQALDFCFAHGEAIQKLSDLKFQAENDLASSLQKALTGSGYKYFKKYPYNITVRTANDDITVMLYIQNLFSAKKIDLRYWLGPKLTKQWNQVPDHFELKERVHDRFVVKEKKQAKEWVELVRTEILLDAQDVHENIEEQIVAFLIKHINPVNEIVYSILEKHAIK